MLACEHFSPNRSLIISKKKNSLGGGGGVTPIFFFYSNSLAQICFSRMVINRAKILLSWKAPYIRK